MLLREPPTGSIEMDMDLGLELKDTTSLSAMLSSKVREQAKEIQMLLQKVEDLEERLDKRDDQSLSICMQSTKSPLYDVDGVDSILGREGPPSFKEHHILIKQLANLSKEYRQVNKKLEDFAGEKRQLRIELTGEAHTHGTRARARAHTHTHTHLIS